MMGQPEIPVAGSLSARVIRACPKHAECDLDCLERHVEDLGEVARFDNRSLIERVKEKVRGLTGS